MYWKAVNLKYDGDRIRVGILIFESQIDKNPILNILSCLENNGIKRKWRKPMKIKRWLLYSSHSYPYASRFLKKTIFNEPYKVKEMGEREMLYGFDKDIIMKKFPSMTKEWRVNKKKRK